MATDLQLHCERTFFRKRRIVIREPEELRKTAKGTFRAPPPQWTSTDRLIASVDVLDRWARDAAGGAIVRAVNQHAQQHGGLARVLISSDEKLRPDTLAAPWELLEHTPAEFRSAQLAVVRLFDPNAPKGTTDSVKRIKLLALYADPAGNIAEMSSHVKALQNFADENDERLEAKILCFEDAETVATECVGFDPHVVYFIGHGTQGGTSQVRLQIGTAKKPDSIDLTGFAALLNRTGSPRLVILNACEAFAGSVLDPYLGAALRLAPQFDFIVAMQMKEPVRAATEFAAELLGAIVRGEGLAAAMCAARSKMAASAEPDFEVTPYIPVLMQRTRLDLPFSIDAGEQELDTLKKLMAPPLQQPLWRQKEASIRRVLTREAGTRRVSILTGPLDCGKSTTVLKVLDALLTIERIRQGERYLYSSARGLTLVDDPAAQVQQVLQHFARQWPRFTKALDDRLAKDDPRSPNTSLTTFATWLDQRQAAGYQFIVVLDDLPPALATDIATVASGKVTAGHLMLVSREHAVAAGVLIERITLGMMSEGEIAAALPGRDAAEVQRVTEETGGLPLFVAAAVRRMTEESGGLPLFVAAEARGETAQPGELPAGILGALSAAQRELLRVIAASSISLPKEVITKLRVDPSLLEGMVTPILISVAGDGAWSLPRPVRSALLADLTPEDEFNIRQNLAAAYENVAYHERTGGFRRARVIRFYEEALRQRTRMLALRDVDPEPEETLAAAQADAFDLDYELLEEGNEPGAAKAIWTMLRSAAAKAGFGDDRQVDARYARCLQRLGSVDEADEILASLTQAGHEDALQVRILLLHADVLKDLGRKGGRAERLRLLTLAREINDELRESGAASSAVLDDHEGEIEWSLGNVLGYGEKADPQAAIRHIARAVEIFERLRDDRAESAYAERIEIARYNGMLSEAERIEAIERIGKSTEALLARSVRQEAINRLYELGRLETDGRAKAKWFRAAYERAGDGYAPLGWHAAIHWKCAEVEAGDTPFAAAAPDIIACCEKLEAWKQNAWSRRVLRNAYRFLAKQYGADDAERQRHFLLSCKKVIDRIRERSEGARDREIRAQVDEEIRGPTPAGGSAEGGTT